VLRLGEDNFQPNAPRTLGPRRDRSTVARCEHGPGNERAALYVAVGHEAGDRLRDDSPAFPPVFRTPNAAATSALATRMIAAP